MRLESLPRHQKRRVKGAKRQNRTQKSPFWATTICKAPLSREPPTVVLCIHKLWPGGAFGAAYSRSWFQPTSAMTKETKSHIPTTEPYSHNRRRKQHRKIRYRRTIHANISLSHSTTSGSGEVRANSTAPSICASICTRIGAYSSFDICKCVCNFPMQSLERHSASSSRVR